MIVIDANPPPDTILRVCQIANAKGIPVWFEPTSVSKSRAMASPEILSKITYISPNKAEIIEMAKILHSYPGEISNSELVTTLIAAGVPNVIMKMGADGVLLGTRKLLEPPGIIVDISSVIHLRKYDARKVQVINVTGAGDSMVGALVHFIVSGYSLEESIPFGINAAELSLASDFAVSPFLDQTTVMKLDPSRVV